VLPSLPPLVVKAAAAHLLALLLAASGTSCAAAFASDLQPALVVERQALAAAHMAGSEEGDGRFVYELDLLAGGPLDNDHIVRQAGAGYGLSMYMAHAGRLDLAPRLARALEYYRSQSLPFIKGGVLVADGDLAGAQTGATALALLTELFFWESTRDTAYEDLRRDWLLALAALWQPEGGFASGPKAADRSPYYDGETWLALAHFERLFPGDPLVSDVLAKVDREFLVHYREHPDIGFMHWGLLAAGERYKSTGEEIFAQYAAHLAEHLLTELQPYFSPNSNACYLVEGLVAAAALLEHRSEFQSLLARLSTRIEAELVKALDLQLMLGQTQIDFGIGRFFYDESLSAHAGAFLNGRFFLRSRIDFTQHCLAALIGYEQWQKARMKFPIENPLPAVDEQPKPLDRVNLLHGAHPRRHCLRRPHLLGAAAPGFIGRTKQI
jgi:hypothetical protein